MNPEKWYTITELVLLASRGLLPFKGRNTWLGLINSGKLKAIDKGKGRRKLYMLQGKDVLNYLDAIKVRKDPK